MTNKEGMTNHLKKLRKAIPYALATSSMLIGPMSAEAQSSRPVTAQVEDGEEENITRVEGFVTSENNVNIRTSPDASLDGNKAGHLTPGVEYKVVGMTLGSDKHNWYLLDSGNWVREDVVNHDKVKVNSTPATAEVETPEDESAETPPTLRERQPFEEWGISTFETLIVTEDNLLQIKISKGYFEAETNIEGLTLSESAVQQAANHLFDKTFSAATTDLANRERITIGWGSQVTIAPFFQDSSIKRKQKNEISGTLNRVIQYVVSFEEFEAISSVFRENPKNTAEYMKQHNLDESLLPSDTSTLPEHVELYATRTAIGIAYFLPDGTLVVINHPLRNREQERDKSDLINIIVDSFSALSTALERSVTFPGGKVGWNRNSGEPSNPNQIFEYFGCYGGTCPANTPSITTLA